MGFKPRSAPTTTLGHTLWLQTGPGRRIDYAVQVSFQRTTRDYGHCVVELDAMPGEWPRKTARFQADHNLAGITLATWVAAEALLLTSAYREGRLTWNGSSTLGLPIPPHLAQLVHESFFVTFSARTGDFDRATLIEGLGRFRCGDSAEEGQYFADYLAANGSARRLFPTKERAESMCLVAESLGLRTELASASPEIPDAAVGRHWLRVES